MAPWDKLPKNLQKAILGLVVLYSTSSCCGPMVCDPLPPPTMRTPMICDPPPPPPTTTPQPMATPAITPMICDPAPPPPITPMICDPPPPPPTTTIPTGRSFQIRSLERSSNPNVEGAEVTGTVLDPQGQPLGGLLVIAETSGLQIQTTTDPSGAFFMRIREPGSYRLTVEGDQSGGLTLDININDQVTVVLEEIAPESRVPLPLAEIRAVDIFWEDGLTFGAETPWPNAHYRWSVSGGMLAESDEGVVWQPPAEPGRYLLQVVADWGQAGLAVDALVLVVEEDGSVTIC